MEISVTHVKQKDLPNYAFPDGTRPPTDLAQKAPVSQPPAAAKAASASVAGAEAAAQEANANLAEAMQEGFSDQGSAKRRRLSNEPEGPLPSHLEQTDRAEGDGQASRGGYSDKSKSGEKRKQANQVQALLSMAYKAAKLSQLLGFSFPKIKNNIVRLLSQSDLHR